MPSVMHVALFRLRDGMDENKIASLLQAAREEIPGVVEIHFGANKVRSTKHGGLSTNDQTHALVSRHEHKEHFKNYILHPRHLELMQYICSFAVAPATVVNFYANERPHL
ncbi:hypothetical protein TcYC6_0074340 [Trypanosoma cruzi]|uniref:Stress-response A/B barrel domain-containing protein n=1 Tax=Trypanosoma cruzi (strain CL Brener) TaxID=353153 RepID=Q4DL38_TRYCC|nr:hypothetical protein, conserved [Trypanosoma cruzi]EAN93241.1 hypothetical protein, conserved [Trypanosoma cruzi]KAF8298754.1 hypothetical protein TcYC6_0074340 [Trypanosoma cruzi]|eukprot:XP_815092.1 hypothetical protein [Trypanosoma cruzi strain CL Brener]